MEPSEVWVRNPGLCIRECLEVGMDRIVWDRGYLRKRGIDPTKFMSLYFGAVPYRMLVVGDSEQGAVELRPGFTMKEPFATHPVWQYGQNISDLEKALANEERVVITDLPPAHTGVAKSFYGQLAEMQEEHPDCKVHIHAVYSYRVLFGLGFQSGDIDPRILAQKGKVTLPSGKEVTFERAAESPEWVTLLGMRPVDLKIPRNRCMYNIKSALWAAKHFQDPIRFKTAGEADIDPDAPFHTPAQTNRIFMKAKQEVLSGDKFLCDVCSVQMTCRYFRTGAVCIVPDSEPQELATFFKTRDSETIIDGLGTLLATQTRRLQAGLIEENMSGDLSPEVTKIINTLFDRGVKLAKLVNPSLAAAGAPKFTFNQNTLNAATPQALTAGIVDEFVRRGIPRDQITPEMIMEVLEPEEAKQRAIDITTVPRDPNG